MIRDRRSRLIAVCLAVSVATLAAASISVAQESEESMTIGFGVYGGVGLNSHSGAFAIDTNGTITDRDECGRFESGSGSGMLTGVTVDLPLKPTLRVGISAEYQVLSGEMRYPCVDPARTRMPDGSLASSLTDFVADLDASALTARATLLYKPLDPPLWLSFGPTVSIPFGGSVSAREEIVSPATAHFVSTGGQVRSIATTQLSRQSLVVGLTGALRYEARIGARLWLTPELSYQLPIGTSFGQGDLSIASARATLGILYRLPIPEEPPPPPQGPEPLVAGIRVESVDDDGSVSDTVRFSVSRTITTRLQPLLNYVFFDAGSAELPARYVRRDRAAASTFDERRLEESTVLETYYNVLDIVGARMRRHPEGTLVITGVDPEGGRDMAIARARAERVAAYLEEVWQIDRSRLRIDARQHPEKPTNPSTPEGMQENRRVEIESNIPEITEPVLLADTAYAYSVPRVRLAPAITGSASRWRVRLHTAGTQLLERSGTGVPPEEIEWDADSTLQTLSDGAVLRAEIEAENAAGEVRSSGTIAVRHTSARDSVRYGAGYYSLILFDFNSAELRSEHRRTIELVNQRTTPETRSRVSGFTDRLGEEALNLRLSLQRARAVAAQLRSTVVDATGEGETRELYDNSLPEGRFYSRCVTIETGNP